MAQSAGQADERETPTPFPFTTVALLGGTGSLGWALAAYLLQQYSHIKIRIYSRGEHRQAEMHSYFADERRLSFLIGDVRDSERLQLALRHCDLVIHTAALKRVDTAEYNPYEAVATNVIGTWNVLKAALDMGVRQVVTISSDKAVKSQTLYGNTKAVAESLTIQCNHYAGEGTRYSVVRYGNVAASASSVIPLWQACAQRGDPLPLTHPSMSRFWLSMGDAVRIVCFVASQQSRGGLFIPHLPTFSVLDLARAVLNLPSGASLRAGRDVVTIGLRGMEKIAEDLATEEELERAYWCAPSEQVPCMYLVPPAVQHWETPVVDTGWQSPPAPCLMGTVAGGPGPVVAYNSETWPWKLGVEDLRARLASIGGPGDANR